MNISFDVSIVQISDGLFAYEAKQGAFVIKRREGFSSKDEAIAAAQRDLAKDVADEHIIKPFSKSLEKMAKDLDRNMRRSGTGRASFKIGRR